MPVPTQTEMFSVVLELMADGHQYSRKEMNRRVLESLDITAEEALQKTDSGVLVYESRVGWSISYLSRAKLIDRVKRGVYSINDDGRKTLAEKLGSDEMWYRLNDRINELDPWKKGSSKKKAKLEGEKPKAPVEKESPREQISALAAELNADLANELLAMIMEQDPTFFEHVVVELLEKMGYGKGVVTKRSGDGGIDGLITTDELGFRPICTQAKRYAANHKIGSPDLQRFVGALNGASNGVFITTSSFTADAVEYAEKCAVATLSLIDGERLTELMIKYNLGVATDSVIEIKRIDSDYFEMN